MTTNTLTVDVPSGVYLHIKKRADEANRSVEDEVLDLLAATVPAAEQADAELRQSILSLDLLENAALERAAQSHLLAEFALELESLHFKKQREALTDAESKRAAELVRAYERSMLIRAHAAALLKKRGVDIAHLVIQP